MTGGPIASQTPNFIGHHLDQSCLFQDPIDSLFHLSPSIPQITQINMLFALKASDLLASIRGSSNSNFNGLNRAHSILLPSSALQLFTSRDAVQLCSRRCKGVATNLWPPKSAGNEPS
ncbi:hypothetical protein PM082_010174 [Marasmius tenuissimus]|nr:hypothetical protein PM082_010174 [Marasmius tenuissimus]